MMSSKPNNSRNKTENGADSPEKAKGPFSIFSSQSLWLKLIIIGQMALLGFQLSPDISTNGDDAVYYILGKSLASGHGYRNLHIVNAQVATQYPVVFPAFLAITHFFTDKPLLAKILVMCMGCLVTLCAFYLFGNWLGQSACALALCLMIGASAVLNQHAIELLSEIPYVLLSLISLLLLEKSYKAPDKKWLFWLTIFVSILPMNCRSIGIAFSAAFLLTNLLQKKYKYVLAHFVVVVAAAILFKMLTSWDNPYLLQLFQRNSYDPEQGLASFAEMFTRITTNIGKYSLEILPQNSMPSIANHNQALSAILGLIMVFFIAVGCIRNFFLQSRFLSFYALFYCGILSMWQVQWSSGRFLAGILPPLFFLFFIGISWSIAVVFGDKKHAFISRIKTLSGPTLPAINKIAIICIWVVGLTFTLDATVFQLENAGLRKQSSRDWENFNACADWIRCNTPESAIVVSRKPELVFLRAKRQGMIYQFSHDAEKVIADIKQKKASYILFDGFYWTGTTGKYLYPALVGHPEMYRMVYALRNPDTFVLEIINK